MAVTALTPNRSNNQQQCNIRAKFPLCFIFFNNIFFSFLLFSLGLKCILCEYFLAMAEKWCKKVEALKPGNSNSSRERKKCSINGRNGKEQREKNSVEVSTIKKSHTLARDSLRKMELHKEAIKICNLSTVCM